MQKLLQKLGPLGVMTACTIWLCWTQLREPTPLLAATEANLPRIERKMLFPEISPATERDPFLAPQSEAPSAVVELPDEEPEEPGIDPLTLISTVRLDATMLGARRVAVINGKVYVEGQTLLLQAAPDTPVRLERVLPGAIVVTIENKRFHIDASGKSGAAASPDVNPPLNPAVKQDPDPPTPRELETEIQDGIPNPDQLQDAVADSLARQSLATDQEDSLDSDETGENEPIASEEDELCEYEQELLITNRINELLDNDE